MEPNFKMMNSKTLGKENAALFTSLAEQGKFVFSIADAQQVSGKNYQATLQALHRLAKAGWLVGLGAGKYAIVSPEAGAEAIPVAGRLVIGRELVDDAPYYFSYDTALEIHNLITRPITDVTIATPRRLGTKKILNFTYQFIYTQEKDLWGIEDIWASEGERVTVSDLERTVIDILARPDLCGGVSEVAEALKIGKEKFDWDKLTTYAQRFDNQSVMKRLGYLLDLLDLTPPSTLEKLQGRISQSYAILDPFLPDEGKYLSQWKIKVNIDPDDLEKAAST